VEILILSVISLFGRQWSQWEILTISLGVLFVLVWMTKQQRSKKVRSKYHKNQFVDSSPLIGLKFGAHKKSPHIVNNFKKDRLAPVEKHQNKHHIQTKEPLEEPHEEHKQLQKEPSKHKQAKVHFGQQVSELTADNEKLRREIAELEQAESQDKQHIQTLEKLQEEIKQLQNEISEHKQAKVSFEQQVSELTADNEQLLHELAELEQAESQNEQHLQTKEFLDKLQEEIKLLQHETYDHKQAKIRFEQQITELTTHNEKLQRELDKSKQAESQNKEHLQALEKLHEENKQLQNEITEHKQAKGRFEQQVSELTAENEKLQCELAKFEQVESQIAEMTATYKLVQPEDSQVEQISEQQAVAEPAVEEPSKRKTARRSKTHEHQHRTVDGVRKKLCRKCKEWKPESEFHKNSSSKDGLAGSCKICKNIEAKKQRRRRQTAQR
jgi:chromosome segregation ATPase